MKAWIYLLFSLLPSVLAQSTIYEPARPGNSQTYVPFAIPDVVGGVRFQQVYGSAAFSPVAPSGGYITALTFFLRNELGGMVRNAQINFSTTGRGVDSLSSVFADNVGIDDHVVLGPGSFEFVGASQTEAVTLQLNTPFFYNPAIGNLLMDVRVTQGFNPQNNPSPLVGSTSAFDRSSAVGAYGVNSLSGTADTFGLVTGFTITSVSEPSLAALALAALIFVSLFGLRKNQN